jgi:hypothetical protein
LVALEAQNASLRCRVEELECERNRERGKQLDALQVHHEKNKKQQQQQQQTAHISRLSTAFKTLKKTLSAAKLAIV